MNSKTTSRPYENHRKTGTASALTPLLLLLAGVAFFVLGACDDAKDKDVFNNTNNVNNANNSNNTNNVNNTNATSNTNNVNNTNTTNNSNNTNNVNPCTETPEARTGTTVYLLDADGNEVGVHLEVGTEITVSVVLDITVAPGVGEGAVRLANSNLTVDASSFTFDGAPVALPEPFNNTLPIIMTAGQHEIRYTAMVVSEQATVEVGASLWYGELSECYIERSNSLSMLQVLGGQSITGGMNCYNLDEARSVQVTPFVPLASTGAFQTENGLWDEVLIDGLVVGGPQCPGQGVMVHQIQRCFTRDASTVVTLSGHAYGNEPWFVDDIFLVEVIDTNGTVLAALSTYQESNQVLGCCFTPPCTTSLEYAATGDAILNLIQGGGNNGDIPAGAFDITPYLPSSGSFYLRFTGLDQGIEGALDRVFMNID